MRIYDTLHFSEAERLLNREAHGDGPYSAIHERDIQRAQVHATLALVELLDLLISDGERR